jgi:hypothetical protein
MGRCVLGLARRWCRHALSWIRSMMTKAKTKEISFLMRMNLDLLDKKVRFSV